jgi:hypothetical protein
MLNMTLYNILKEFSVLITIYLDIKLCGLEQYNNRVVLVTKSCKDCRERIELSFYWDAFDIERII